MQLPVAIGPLVFALLVLCSVLSLTGAGLLAASHFGGSTEAKRWGIGSLWAAAAVVGLIVAVFASNGDSR